MFHNVIDSMMAGKRHVLGPKPGWKRGLTACSCQVTSAQPAASLACMDAGCAQETCAVCSMVQWMPLCTCKPLFHGSAVGVGATAARRLATEWQLQAGTSCPRSLLDAPETVGVSIPSTALWDTGWGSFCLKGRVGLRAAVLDAGAAWSTGAAAPAVDAAGNSLAMVICDLHVVVELLFECWHQSKVSLSWPLHCTICQEPSTTTTCMPMNGSRS